MNNEMLFIPRTNFIMGLSKEQTEAVVAEFTPASSMISPFLFYHEAPEHSVKIPDFTISKYEVTNAEYKKFIDDGGYEKKELWKELIDAHNLNTVLQGWERIELFVDRTGKRGPSMWSDGTYTESRVNHPVEGVSWFEAVAYCRWNQMRLPTEAEWEYSARGTDQRMFPWGNERNVAKDWPRVQGGQSTPVGSVQLDKSPFGVMDLARNISEWVMDDWYLYPGAPVDPHPENDNYGILRGGDYFSQLLYMRATCRFKTPKLERRGGIGFRCAK
jgi:formylglycine-generating enzyme required for sulfatase activity